METTEQTTVLNAIAFIQNDLQEVKTQNQELQRALHNAMNQIPTILRQELENFLVQFTQALENREPSQTAAAIRELTAVLQDLKQQLTDSDLMNAEMNSQTQCAVEEIRNFANRLSQSNLTMPPKPEASQT